MRGVSDLLDGVVRKLRAGGPAAPGRAPMPNLVPVSLSLWAGLCNVLFAFTVGAPVVLLDRFTPAGFAAAVRRRHPLDGPAARSHGHADRHARDEVGDLAPLRYVRSITAPAVAPPGPGHRTASASR